VRSRPQTRAKQRRTRKRRAAKREGFASYFELQVANEAKQQGIELEYEKLRIKYDLGTAHYVPDFTLPNGIIVETKGDFTSKDRRKHLLIKEQHGDAYDIRFVFQANNKLSSKSKTRYTDWCEQHGFKYAIGLIPPEWAGEGPKRS
jgi:hypothetical protein